MGIISLQENTNASDCKFHTLIYTMHCHTPSCIVLTAYFVNPPAEEGGEAHDRPAEL